VERAYRIVSRRDLPLISHADFALPREALTLVRIEDGGIIHVNLPRRYQWEVGDTVQIDDATISANLI
jgi:hypothetical protein